jgi:hypothetical protein
VAIDRVVMIWRWVLLLRAANIAIATGTRRASSSRVRSSAVSCRPASVATRRARGACRRSRPLRRRLRVVDRMLGILSLAAPGAAGLAAWTPDGVDPLRIVAAVAVLGAACVAAFWGDALLRAALPAHRHSGPVARRLLRLADAVAHYRGHRGALAHVMAWSLAVQVLRIVQAYVLGLGLGLTVPFAYYLLVMPLGLLMLLLPISVSGFGVPQGIIVWLLRPMGVPDAASFARSTLIVLTGSPAICRVSCCGCAAPRRHTGALIHPARRRAQAEAMPECVRALLRHFLARFDHQYRRARRPGPDCRQSRSCLRISASAWRRSGNASTASIMSTTASSRSAYPLPACRARNPRPSDSRMTETPARPSNTSGDTRMRARLPGSCTSSAPTLGDGDVWRRRAFSKRPTMAQAGSGSSVSSHAMTSSGRETERGRVGRPNFRGRPRFAPDELTSHY